MGVRYSIYNRTKKEYIGPESIPVDGEDPTSFPYAALLANLLVNTWRHDHVVILDDSGDFDNELNAKDYRDRSVELWNEFVTLYKGSLKPCEVKKVD
jgi:hypothetical protein